jgi:hypothetical protein
MLSVDENAVLEVRAVIANLTERWAAVPVGGKLELSQVLEVGAS